MFIVQTLYTFTTLLPSVCECAPRTLSGVIFEREHHKAGPFTFNIKSEMNIMTYNKQAAL